MSLTFQDSLREGRLKRAYDTYQNDPRTVNLRLGQNMDYAEAF